ncbi:RuvB-like helicase 2 [Nosema granulosis]|uniref:RuvB-like helicase n=1 Tax=Nosema granulosis TaxID=83296 RepID=A0A9P6KY24_9MICR|nr:RuvB-like helicase 2 [Nosema granulosis]
MEIETIPLIERLGSHSHITGLGENNGEVEYNKDGVVSQIKARKALLHIKKLVQENSSGKIVILRGPSGSGKTALALGLSKSLEGHIFNSINAAEIHSLSMSKAEALQQAIRKSVGVSIKETIRIIEGEVVALSTSKISLRTVDMESTFEIGSNMKEQIDKEKVCVGDIIRIIKERGKIIKLGVGSSKNDPQLLGDIKFLPCPEGELFKVEEEIQSVSLHDLDAINNKTLGYLSLFSGDTNEISSDVRDEVNDKVKKWILEGKVELKRGVLFIDEAHMLNIEGFAFLNKVLGDAYTPTIILATNKKEATSSRSPFGIPKDFIERCLIVPTESYSEEDLRNILTNRINKEEVKLEEAALRVLVDICVSSGLRYAFNVISLCEIRRIKSRKQKVEERDIKRVCELFLDEKGIRNLLKY